MKLGQIFNTIDSWGITILRIGLGIIFVAHGGQKIFGWFGGSGFETTIHDFHQNLGISIYWAILAMIAEFFGGLGIILGCLTRVAAFGICCVMVVAIAKVHLPHGFFLNWYCLEGLGHGFEYNIALLAMAFALLFSGPGNVSIDKWISEL